jgi:AcrR family transcriptional regulator
VARARSRSSATKLRAVVPRREPRTAAGVVIRDAILDAAERVLEEHGIEGLSTNVVAERAGVSVGSLYQYYPNKEAVLAGVASRLDHRTSTLIQRELAAGIDEDLPTAVGRVVDVLLGRDIGGHRMRRALRHVVAPAWTDEESARVDAEVRAAVVESFARRADVRAGPHLIMAWIASHSVEMVIETVVASAPELLGEPVFRQELVTLVVRYLRPDPSERV